MRPALLAALLVLAACAAPEPRYETEALRFMHHGSPEADQMPSAFAWPDGVKEYRTWDGCNSCHCTQTSPNAAVCACTLRNCEVPR